MPLVRNILEEVKFILKKLIELDVFPNFTTIDREPQFEQNTDQAAAMDTNIVHLFMFHNLFTDFIETKENEIKVLIKKAFNIIYNYFQ